MPTAKFGANKNTGLNVNKVPKGLGMDERFDPFVIGGSKEPLEDFDKLEQKPIPISEIIKIDENDEYNYEKLLIDSAKNGNYKLVIELAPESLADFTSLTLFGGDLHRKISAVMIKKSKSRCKVCNHVGALYLHDVWNHSEDLDEGRRVSYLRGFQMLCIKCFDAKHLGLQMTKSKRKEVFNHFCEINGVASQEASDYIQGHLILRAYRSKFEWVQDVNKILPSLEKLD